MHHLEKIGSETPTNARTRHQRILSHTRRQTHENAILITDSLCSRSHVSLYLYTLLSVCTFLREIKTAEKSRGDIRFFPCIHALSLVRSHTSICTEDFFSTVHLFCVCGTKHRDFDKWIPFIAFSVRKITCSSVMCFSKWVFVETNFLYNNNIFGKCYSICVVFLTFDYCFTYRDLKKYRFFGLDNKKKTIFHSQDENSNLVEMLHWIHLVAFVTQNVDL